MKLIITSLILFSILSFTTSLTTNKKNDLLIENAKIENNKLEWHTDFAKANEKSTKTGKPIFAFFTGSDWCGWCKRLQAAVFVKPAFIAWANKNVILLELDFPRRTTQAAELKKQNRELAGLFKVSGYPTCWMFNTSKNAETNQINIQAFGSLGYPSGAVKGKEEVKFIETANGILANKK